MLPLPQKSKNTVKCTTADVKTGDVFATPLPEGRTAYFQCIATTPPSQYPTFTIRAFEVQDCHDRNKTYTQEKINSITALPVKWYANSHVYWGIGRGYWYKIGNAPVTDPNILKDFWFARTDIPSLAEMTHEVSYDLNDKWEIWHEGEKLIKAGRLSAEVKDKTYDGLLTNEHDTFWMLWLGFKPGRNFASFNLGRNRPYSHIELYIKETLGEYDVYYHFKGNDLVECVIINTHKPGKGIVKSGDEVNVKFGDINWEMDNYISRREYEEAKTICSGSRSTLIAMKIKNIFRGLGNK